MMLSIDVCLMFDCFLFEKFYLHYALWTLISFCDTALKYLFAKDRSRTNFYVTFEPPPPPPPIEKYIFVCQNISSKYVKIFVC